jgi:hypothetical protein
MDVEIEIDDSQEGTEGGGGNRSQEEFAPAGPAVQVIEAVDIESDEPDSEDTAKCGSARLSAIPVSLGIAQGDGQEKGGGQSGQVAEEKKAFS